MLPIKYLLSLLIHACPDLISLAISQSGYLNLGRLTQPLGNTKITSVQTKITINNLICQRATYVIQWQTHMTMYVVHIIAKDLDRRPGPAHL
jgi:hypothetical protein